MQEVNYFKIKLKELLPQYIKINNIDYYLDYNHNKLHNTPRYRIAYRAIHDDDILLYEVIEDESFISKDKIDKFLNDILIELNTHNFIVIKSPIQLDLKFCKEWIGHAVVLLSSWHQDGTGWSDWDTKVFENLKEVQNQIQNL